MTSAGPAMAFVGLGSNLSGPAKQLARAIDRLRTIDDIDIEDVSSLYRSGPLGGIEQPEFLNAVVAVTTSLDPRGLLSALQRIEAEMGRDRSVRRWGPRNIDLDLLVFSDLTVRESDLTVPHPGIGERNFVLLPLRDIAPDLVIPGLGSIANIEVPPEPGIQRISDRLWHTSA